MDLKGITWAGNIYQKFEAMCLEVQEVMYEDTVKYVENQVQKVGVTVKKFYSDVMPDLLPPSCVDPVKVAAGDLSLNPYSHADLGKPKTSILELKKNKTKDEDISDLAAEESSLRVHNDVNHLFPPSLRGLVEKTYLNACPTKSTKVGVCKRPIGIKRISQNNHPPKVSRPMASLSGDKSRLLVCDIRSSCAVASDEINVTSPSEFSGRHHFEEAVNGYTPISDASHKILTVDLVTQEKDDCKCSSRPFDKTLSAGSDGSQCTSSCQGLTVKPIDKFGKDGSFSQINSNIGNNTCSVESVVEEVILCCEDDFDMEVIENEDAVEPVEISKLEETCILVDSDKLHFVSQETGKHKSYKKKIREALSSKLRPTRKQDQFVSQYKDVCASVNPAVTMDYDERKLKIHDSFESDWELL